MYYLASDCQYWSFVVMSDQIPSYSLRTQVWIQELHKRLLLMRSRSKASLECLNMYSYCIIALITFVQILTSSVFATQDLWPNFKLQSINQNSQPMGAYETLATCSLQCTKYK